MLCEKCGRRQAEWGNLCKECETVGAMEDRKAELFSIVRTLARSAMSMMVIDLVLSVICIVVEIAVYPTWYMWLLIALAVLCVGLCGYEWYYWQRIVSRLNNGEWVQTAYDLLHHPKGLWKRKLRDPDSAIFYHRRTTTFLVFRITINKLYNERRILEQMAQKE